MESSKVVITGLGALTPIGNNVLSYWNNLIAGKNGIGLITKFDTLNHKTKFACELKEYNPRDYFSLKEIKRLDPFAQYAMISSNEAIQDADLINPLIDKERVGVIWGSGIGGLGTTEATILKYYKDHKSINVEPFFIPKIIPDIPAGIKRSRCYYSRWLRSSYYSNRH